jgi:hypothetical protein
MMRNSSALQSGCEKKVLNQLTKRRYFPAQ